MVKITLKYFPLLFKDTEIILKNLKSEKFSALLISVVPRILSITLDFQCDFQCHNFIVKAVFYTFSQSAYQENSFSTHCLSFVGAGNSCRVNETKLNCYTNYVENLDSTEQLYVFLCFNRKVSMVLADT